MSVLEKIVFILTAILLAFCMGIVFGGLVFVITDNRLQAAMVSCVAFIIGLKILLGK